MTTTSATSSIVNSLGAGSGVDMVALANQLAEAQFASRNIRLTEKSEVLEQQISVASSVRNTLSLFASALGDRVRSGDLASRPTISNGAVATVSSPIGALGKGSYSLEVTRLATAQTLSGPPYGSGGDTVGAGTLTFRFGAASTTGFTEDAGSTPLSITVAPGDTLDDVAAAINGKGAGLTAYVSQTTAGAQLVIKGEEGAQNGFVIEASEDAANPGLGALAWQPGSDPARLIATSADAAYLLDGLARTSASNTIDNAAPGLSLALTGTNAGAPATIGFASTSGAITTAMQDLVSALNEIIGQVRSAIDPLSGDLSRDPGARALARELSALGSQVIMPDAPEGSPRTLAELGVAVERDGSYRLDVQRLQAVLAQDPEGVTAMFTPGLNGIFATVDKLARANGTAGDPGSLAGSIARYQAQSQQVSDDLADLADDQETLRANMVARFAKAESRISASQSTLTFLQAQIDAWNAQSD